MRRSRNASFAAETFPSKRPPPPPPPPPPSGDPNAMAFFSPTGAALVDNPKFIVDNSDPNNIRVYVNQTGPVPYPPATPSGAGFQYSSNIAGRAALRLSQYGNNGGAQNVSFFKSRGLNVGDMAAVIAGDTILVASRIAGTSFTVQSTNVTDVGVNVFWQLWEPAP